VAYLDAVGGRRPSEAVITASSVAAREAFADPRALHAQGRRARLLLDTARASLAASLGVPIDTLTVHAGREAAARFALEGLVRGHLDRARGAPAAGAVEHSSVLHAADAVAGGPGQAVRLPVDAAGRIDPQALVDLLADSRPSVLAVQSANQEVGTRQPLDAVAAACTSTRTPLLVDACATAAWEPLPLEGDALIVDAAQWGGPRGIALVVVRSGVRFRPPAPAPAPSELDAAALVAAATALEECRRDPAARQRTSDLVARIRSTVAHLPDVEVVGDPIDRAPHLVTFSCLYVSGEALVQSLAEQGYAVGSGSACTADTLEPSHVLAAMGALTHGNVRIGLSPSTTDAEVDGFLAVLPGIVADLRRDAGAP
jgi:cysteine desulfurase